MPRKYQQFPFQDIGLGLDTYSPKDKIKPGALSDALNIDAESNGTISLRKGYERYYGNFPFKPIKIESLEKDGEFYYHLTFDTKETIDFSLTPNGPLKISGSTGLDSEAELGGDGISQWYETFKLPFLKTFALQENVDFGIYEEVFDTEPLFLALAQSDGQTEIGHSVLDVDNVRINDLPGQWEAYLRYETESDFNGFFLYLTDYSSIGEYYEVEEEFDEIGGIQNKVMSIEPNLFSQNYIVYTYFNYTGGIEVFKPSDVKVYTSTGNIDVEFEETNITITAKVLAVDDKYTKFFTQLENTEAVQFINVDGVEKPFNFVQVWAFDTDENGDSVKYLLDVSSVDYIPFNENGDPIRRLKIGYKKPEGIPEQVQVVWAPADYEGNILEIEAKEDTQAYGVSEDVNFDVWGLDHGLSYYADVKSSGGGFVHHIDNYRSSEGEKAMACLGGSLFESVSYEDANLFSTEVSGSVQSATPKLLAPLFGQGGDQVRTRGETAEIKGDGQISSVILKGNYAAVSEIVVADNVTYTIPLTEDITLNDNLESGDILSVLGCRHTANNGSFSILSFAKEGDEETGYVLKITTEKVSQKAESNTGAKSNVFTDNIEVTPNNALVAGDRLGSSFVPKDFPFVLKKGDNGEIAKISDITSPYTFASGITLYTVRTSNTVPVEAISVNGDGFVLGDMVRLGSSTYRIKDITGSSLVLDNEVTFTSLFTPVTVDGRWKSVLPPVNLYQDTIKNNYGGVFTENSYTNQPFIKSSVVSNSMYFANGEDAIKKYDGDRVYDAGLPPFQSWAFIDINPEIQALPSGAVVAYSDVNKDGKYFEIDNNSLSIGDRIKHSETGKIFTVSKVGSKEATTVTYKVFVAEDIADAEVEATTTSLIVASAYRYYIKHSLVDRNNQNISSVMLGADDLFIEVFESCAIQLKICAMPAYAGFDHAFIDTEIYRTRANTAGPFYNIATYRRDYEAGAGYIVHNDAKRDDAISTIADLDEKSSNLLGGELGTRWNLPPKAKVLTSADNRLVLGNITSPPLLDVTFRKKDTVVALSSEDFNGDTVKIKKTKEDETTANQELTFEFKSSGEVTIESHPTVTFVGNDSSDVKVNSDEITLSADHGYTTGDAVRIIAPEGATMPQGLTANTTYYVIVVNDNTVKFAPTREDAIASTSIINIGPALGSSDTFEVISSDIEVFDGYAVIHSPSHSVVAGDWVYFFHSTKERQKDLRGSGWYRVDQTSENDFIISTKHQQDTALGTILDVDRYITSTDGKVPVWLGDDGNFNYKYEDTLVIEDRAATRLSLAINAVMATENPENVYWETYTRRISGSAFDSFDNTIEITGHVFDNDQPVVFIPETSGDLLPNGISAGTTYYVSIVDADNIQIKSDAGDAGVVIDFAEPSGAGYQYDIVFAPSGVYSPLLPSPWLLSQGGQSYPTGALRIYQTDALNGEIEFTHTSSTSSTDIKYDVYLNSLLKTKSKDVSEIRRFNSRLCVSYRNNPEIFNDCYNAEDRSGQVIDINPADGQEITAAVPFFGTAAFGAAQLSQSLVVFKTNSVYLVDIASNLVQKLQTQGQGCTAPNSVAVTKNGIFFANESGIYRLGTDMKIIWVGRAIDGIWREGVDKTNMSLFSGHNYVQKRRYKLSYPIKGGSVNSSAFVYDSAREELKEVGSWTVYDNHPALGWCNQTADSFFAGTDGRVYKIRNRDEASDYRDDDKGIPLSFTFGATSFQLPDERKITDSVTVQFQNEYGTLSGIKVLTEQSLSGTFNLSGTVTIPEDTADKPEGDEKKESTTIRFSLPQRKGTHVRTKIEKEAIKDESFQISSLTYGVRTTGSDGVPQSRKYRS